MRPKTPHITLLTGGALGVILLVASMSATTKPPAGGSGGGSAAAGTAPGGTTAAPAIPGCGPATASAKSLSHVRRSAVGLGGRPFAVIKTPDRRFSFVTRGDSLAVLSNGSGLAPALVHTLQVPGANKGEAITKDGKYLLLATGGGAKVLSAGDAEQGKVVVLGTLDSPKGGGAVQVALSPDDQFAFVTLQNSGGMAVFNLRQALADGFAAASFVGIVPTGKESVGVAVSADPGHKWLYVTDWGPPGTISVVNMHLAETDPGKALPAGHPLPAGCQPSRVVTSSHGRYVWVTAQASNALLAFSAARLRTDPAHALIATVPVGKNPIGEKAINHDRQIVVANSGRPHSLMVIDTQKALCREGKRALVGSIATGKGPREFDLADGRTLLVTNLGSGRLAAVSINDIPLTSQSTPPGQCRNGG